MTEHITLTFNSDKYPDGTIRNQFKIDIQSQSYPIKKEDDNIHDNIHDNIEVLRQRLSKLSSKDRSIKILRSENF